MPKQMPKAENPKNFTVRLDEAISGVIRKRAKDLDMSLSYYIAAVCSLDETYGFIEHYGDPLEKKPEDAMTKEQVEEALRKLQAAGHTVTLEGDTAPIAPAQATSDQSADQQRAPSTHLPVPPSKQAITETANQQRGQAKRPPPERPKMLSVQELVAAHGANAPGIAGQMAGGIGDISAKMQQALQMAAKEERDLKKLKQNVLQAMGEEVNDDGQTEEG